MHYDLKKIRQLPLFQQSIIQDIVGDIFEHLDERALNEVFSGYQSDVDMLLGQFTVATNEALYAKSPEGIDLDEFHYLKNLTNDLDESLKKLVLNYFIITSLPDFEMNWHHIEWGILYQLYQRLSLIASRGGGKTFAKDTLIPMYDGTLKKVQDIRVNDKVMGPDSKPRRVKETHITLDTGFEIKPTKGGLSYKVSSEHILHFKKDKFTWDKKSKRSIKIGEEVVEMPAKDFYNKSDYYKEKSFGYRIKGWELSKKKLEIDPYILGIWLGDGTSSLPAITTIDSEIIDAIYQYAEKLGLQISYNDNYTYRFHSGSGAHKNVFFESLRKLNLIQNKHIPEIYFQSSREQRLALLAGIIDSDGNIPDQKNRSRIEIAMKSESLILQIQRLARSLGFKATMSSISTKLKYKDYESYLSYRVRIFGDTWMIPCKLKRKRIKEFDFIQDHQRSSIKNIVPIENQFFYGFEVDGDHLHLLQDGTVVHNSYFFAKAVPLWHLYRYSKSIVIKNPKLGLHHSKKGLIITAEDKLARGHMDEIMTEIETNSILRNALYPENAREKKWGSDLIRTKTGSQLEKRSYGSKMRGMHPGWIVVDDFLTDATLYSIDQREKYIEIFNAVVLHLLEPGGQITIIGTPFHELDLYANIKKRPNWATFEYPAIFPDGTLLWPSKFPLSELMNKLHDGSLTFTREVLVKPISSESSIFRFDHIKRSYEGMDKYTLVNNLESHPQKFEDVVIGTDFAISGAAKADKTSFVVLGTIGKTIWILHIFSKKGMSYGEQIEKLKQFNTNFRPTKIIIEANGMQKIFYQMGIDEGLPVVEHFTGVNKFSLEKGLPALSILYEQYRIKAPRGNDESTGKTDTLAQELMSYTFVGEKLESTSGHGDISMALWQGVIGVNYTGNGFDFSFV